MSFAGSKKPIVDDGLTLKDYDIQHYSVLSLDLTYTYAASRAISTEAASGLETNLPKIGIFAMSIIIKAFTVSATSMGAFGDVRHG